MNTIRFNRGNVKLVAHRGLSGIETENTCAAFIAAGNRDYFGIETDARITADGKFILMHDDTTARVSGVELKVTLEAFGHEHKQAILDAMGQAGYETHVVLTQEFYPS